MIELLYEYVLIGYMWHNNIIKSAIDYIIKLALRLRSDPMAMLRCKIWSYGYADMHAVFSCYYQ